MKSQQKYPKKKKPRLFLYETIFKSINVNSVEPRFKIHPKAQKNQIFIFCFYNTFFLHKLTKREKPKVQKIKKQKDENS